MLTYKIKKTPDKNDVVTMTFCLPSYVCFIMSCVIFIVYIARLVVISTNYFLLFAIIKILRRFEDDTETLCFCHVLIQIRK